MSLVNSAHAAADDGFRLVVTGGGTGGHTYPALTAVRADGLEARVAPAEGIAFTTVATGKIRRSSNPLKMLSAANVRDMARVPLGVAQARKAISDFRPDVVLATGGYVAVPAGLAARLCRRPLVLHEHRLSYSGKAVHLRLLRPGGVLRRPRPRSQRAGRRRLRQGAL